MFWWFKVLRQVLHLRNRWTHISWNIKPALISDLIRRRKMSRGLEIPRLNTTNMPAVFFFWKICFRFLWHFIWLAVQNNEEETKCANWVYSRRQTITQLKEKQQSPQTNKAATKAFQLWTESAEGEEKRLKEETSKEYSIIGEISPPRPPSHTICRACDPPNTLRHEKSHWISMIHCTLPVSLILPTCVGVNKHFPLMQDVSHYIGRTIKDASCPSTIGRLAARWRCSPYI